MANPLFFLTLLALSLSLVLATAITIQDFCVADSKEKGTADTHALLSCHFILKP